MAPFIVGDEAAALESIVGKLQGERPSLLSSKINRIPRCQSAKPGLNFEASPNRPDSGEATLYQYECQFSAFKDWMGKRCPEGATLRDVTSSVAEEYVGTLNHGRLSPNTFNKHVNLLTLVFRVLKSKGKILNNPWEEIQRKRLVTHSRRELTIEEVRKVCQSATGSFVS